MSEHHNWPFAVFKMCLLYHSLMSMSNRFGTILWLQNNFSILLTLTLDYDKLMLLFCLDRLRFWSRSNGSKVILTASLKERV